MDFHCTLEVAKDLLWISGTEKNKRKILNSFIFQEYQKHFGDDFFIDELFPELDFSFIKNTVKQTFEQFHYFANDFSLNNFVRHVAIAVSYTHLVPILKFGLMVRANSTTLAEATN